MRIFLKFLVYRMKSCDGNKNSAVNILKYFNEQAIGAFLSKTQRSMLSKSREHQIQASNEYRVFKKVCMKYTMITIRAKISYMALIQKKTILELFIDVISKTLLKIKPMEEADSEYLNNVMGCIVSGGKGVFHKVMLYNAMKKGNTLPMIV